MKIKSMTLGGLMTVGLAFGPSAYAGPLYAGVGVSRSAVNGISHAARTISITSSLPQTISLNGLPFDDDDAAWSAFIGYSATRYWSVEAGYWNLGSFHNDRLLGPSRAKLSIQEWYLGATVRYPLLHRLALTANAGISQAQFEASGSATVIVPTDPGRGPVPPPFFFPTPPSSSVNIPLATPDDETGFMWGAGLSWTLSDRVDVGVSYGQHDVKVQDVETLSLFVRLLR